MPISFLRKFAQIFGPFKRHAIVLFAILLAGTFFETISIAMILPLLQMVIRPEEILPVGAWVLQIFPKDQHLLIVCLLMLLLVCCKSIFTLLKRYYSSFFVNNLRSYWAAQIKGQYLFSNYTEVVRQKQGVLLNNMLQESSFAAKALRDSVDLVANGLIALGLTTLLLLVNWRITMAIGVLAFSSQMILWHFTKNYAAGVGRKKIKLNQQITQSAAESIAGIRQVKIFSLEKGVLNEFVENMKRLVNLMVRFQVINGLPLVIGEMLMVVIIIGLILFYGYWMKMDVGNLIPVLSLFTVSILRLFSTVSKLLTERISVASYWPSLILVRNLSSRTNDSESHRKGKNLETLKDKIRFDKVDFNFDPSTKLFESLCLEIPRGRITAVIGLSGAGKSTLCDLITKFYEPTRGKILADGIDLKGINVQSWRRRIGYVSQETFLFNSTIAENIAIGLPEGADNNQVVWASQMAGASEFIETFPLGYQTPVGYGGVSLSGGQRQRIAIARALIRDPDLLIFDEATSSLDSKIERQLLESIKNIAGDKAVLFITHRLASLWISDYIYFLEKGRMLESGTYSSLIEAKGALWNLVHISENENITNQSIKIIES